MLMHIYILQHTQGLKEEAMRNLLARLRKFNGGSIRATTKYFVMAVISDIDEGETVSKELRKEADEVAQAYFFVANKDHESEFYYLPLCFTVYHA